MPRGNGTGPQGMGPMTGRAAGFCAGSGQPGFANPVAGRGGGYGRGRGRGGYGRGCRNQFLATGLPGWARLGGASAPAANVDEKQALLVQADALQAQLEGLRKRLSELETPGGAQ